MSVVGVYDVVVLGHDLQVEVTDYYKGEQGFISGAPEDCYPSEPETVEWQCLEGIDPLCAEIIYTFRDLKEDITRQLLNKIHKANVEVEPYD